MRTVKYSTQKDARELFSWQNEQFIKSIKYLLSNRERDKTGAKNLNTVEKIWNNYSGQFQKNITEDN